MPRTSLKDRLGLLSISSAAIVMLAACPIAAFAQDDGTSDRMAQSAETAENTPDDYQEQPSEAPADNEEGIPEDTTGNTPEDDKVTTLRDMFEKGTFDGNLRTLYYSTDNAFFTSGQDQDTVSVGGMLRFTTAELMGFSLQLGAYAQRGIDHSDDPNRVDSYLGPDISALGEAYIQWQNPDDMFRIRVGNQRLDSPFTSTTDWRIIPPLFQGVTARYGTDDSYITGMRITQFKSYINDDFDKTTTYNQKFAPFGPNTTENTDGFWAAGAGHTMNTGPVDLTGQAWFFNYMDYANMYYVDGQIAQAEGSIKPFLGIQYIRETEEGRALLGEVDHHTYGVQMGLKHNSLTATLNYDYIPHREGTFLNGSLVTPYEHNVSSGPYYAQPFLTSTQDLGSGSAYAFDIKGAPFNKVFAGARYSFMDLKPTADSDSISQSEYLVYGIYNFDGALTGLSIANFFGYQVSPIYEDDFFQNRLAVEYSF